MTFFQIAAVLYVVFYFGLIIAFRSYLLYKQTGVNAINILHKDDARGFNEKVTVFFSILVPVIAFNYAFLLPNYEFYLVPIPYLEQASIQSIGLIVAFIGLLFSFIAQLQMGTSWRISIHDEQDTALVTSGFFRFSRNPIYLGLGISFFGFFFFLPNAFSLCLLIVMYVTVSIKIRLEEAFMEQLHPKAFPAYKAKVRRWL